MNLPRIVATQKDMTYASSAECAAEGLMTVPLVALRMNRRGYASELNPDYFRDGVGYLQAEENKDNQITMFDIIDATGTED